VKVEQGALRVMAHCLEQAEVKVRRHVNRELKYMGAWEKSEKNSSTIYKVTTRFADY
jgi:hypothetical protein